VYILKEAIERAGSLDPDAVVAEIKKTDRRGVMGRISSTDGNQAIFGMDPKEAAVACVFQWGEKGERVNVFPEFHRRYKDPAAGRLEVREVICIRQVEEAEG